MAKQWNAEHVLELTRGYQAAAVLVAAADLQLFDALKHGPKKAAELAAANHADPRAMTILLDALAAMEILHKQDTGYLLPPSLVPLLSSETSGSILGMIQHQGSCLRRWVQLAEVVKTGRPAQRIPGIRGADADHTAFIEAMHNISAPVAAEVILAVQPLRFKHLLDIGGASGTWTIAFLQACPSARATLFDLAPVLPLAKKRLRTAGMDTRVELVQGDFLADPLPQGADLAWVSAIVHQNSPEENRRLFQNIFQALVSGGRVAIRDILMQPSRIEPIAGALFAINMLVATEGGGTYTAAELSDGLANAGFVDPTVARSEAGMHSILVASKP